MMQCICNTLERGSMHKLSESVADGSYHLKLFISFEIFG